LFPFSGQVYGGEKGGQLCVQLKWYHQSQFAGFYVAEEEGYYAQEGLRVRFLEGGPGVDWLERMSDVSCPLGVSNAYDIVVARSEGIPVRAVASMDQVSPIVFFSLKESGIRDPRQFRGKRVVVVPTGKVHYMGMMDRVGVDLKEVDERPFSLDMTPMYRGEVDVWSGYHTNLVTRAEEEGHQVNIIHPADYGIQIYDDVVYAREEFITGSPEAVEGFLRATFRGWMKAIKEPGLAVDRTLRFAVGADRAHQEKLLLRTIPYVHTGEYPIGWMERRVWEDISALTRRVGLAGDAVAAESLFTDEFLRKVYAGELR
jgi:NitT/TauT family transport system substrate-binding protein